MAGPTRIGQPTRMGGGQPATAAPPIDVVVTPVTPAEVAPAPAITAVSVTPETATLPDGHTTITLSEEQLAQANAAAAAFDFEQASQSDIVQFGIAAEKGLATVLDGFLTGLDRNNAGKVFECFATLQKNVKDANLPAILAQVRNDQPGIGQRLLGKLRGKSVQDLAHEGFEATRGMMAGKTKTLADQMTAMEQQLAAEITKLFQEMQNIDSLKVAYGSHLQEFALAAAISQLCLIKGKAYVEQQRAIANNSPDPMVKANFAELQNKLQLLESRSLALEGVYTRLPADRMVISQIQQAGVSTLQETLTTSASRTASIKMTLLTLHGALAVRGVQQLQAGQKKLDDDLLSIRQDVMKEVTTTAANAAGENRLAQADQIELIIRQTEEINTIVATAKVENARKFGEARDRFAAARNVLATMES